MEAQPLKDALPEVGILSTLYRVHPGLIGGGAGLRPQSLATRITKDAQP